MQLTMRPPHLWYTAPPWPLAALLLVAEFPTNVQESRSGEKSETK